MNIEDVPIGLIAGCAGGQLDTWIIRLVDLILAFPGLILAIWLLSERVYPLTAWKEVRVNVRFNIQLRNLRNY